MTEAFVLVPREPTPEMQAALTELGRITFADAHGRDQFTWFAVKAYRAMIAAAPAPPAQDEAPISEVLADVRRLAAGTPLMADDAYRAAVGDRAPSRAWTDAEVEAAARAYEQFMIDTGSESRVVSVSLSGSAMRAALSTLDTSLQNMQTTQAVSVPSREEAEHEVRALIVSAMWSPASGPVAWTDESAALMLGQATHLADSIIALFTAPQSE